MTVLFIDSKFVTPPIFANVYISPYSENNITFPQYFLLNLYLSPYLRSIYFFASFTII